MLKNHFIIAWRNLKKNKLFSFINIAGLAIGLACFSLIALYVVDELSYDKYNKNAANIYRIDSEIQLGGADEKMAVSSDPMGATLKRDYPQVEQYTRMYNSNGARRIKKGDVYITEKDVINVDSSFFDVFTLPAIAGDTRTALNKPNTVVITEKMANKYFGTTDALGKTLETSENGSTLYKVTAVIKNMPHNSHFQYDVFFPMENVQYRWGDYLSHNFQTYIVLRKGTDPKAFEKNFTAVIDKYVLPQAKQLMNINSMKEFEKAGNKLNYTLTRLTDIHLHSSIASELSANGSIQYVYIFSAVAIFILLIACVNFMNLSTAKSANRAKEVGIRKVLGTVRQQLIRQFLIESILTAFLAFLISILITWSCLSFFNQIAGKELTMAELFNGGFLSFLIVLFLFVGVLAGGYPALYLSSFKPIAVLKGKTNTGVKRSFLRSGLVVFQFATSIFLIIGTVIVFKQLNYIQTQKLGFNRDQVLILDNTGALGNNVEAFKNEVLKLPGVQNGTISGFLPVEGTSRNNTSFSKESVMSSTNSFTMQIWTVDDNYIPALGMDMIKGRNFSKEFLTDTSSMIINESTAALLGYPDPIGKRLYSPIYSNISKTPAVYTIVGVVKNFNFESLHQTIGPLCMVYGQSPWRTSFKLNTADMHGLLGQIESKWKSFVSAIPFNYRFMDNAFDNMYRSEQRVGKVSLTFAILAILIACLGLFGLAAYMAEQRTKEIGVRKVLGATVNNIVTMLSKDFLKLVFIAAIVAFPVAWWFMHQWLQGFAFRINIGWSVFVIAGAIALLIALVTVSFQAIKVALRNPVNSIKSE